jgi:hypothetical protein
MDVDLVTLMIPLIVVLLATAVLVAAHVWARGIESALAAPGPTMPGSDDPTSQQNPTILFQPPEDAPPA